MYVKEYEKAIEDFSYVIKKQENNIDAYINRGCVYYDLNKCKEAIKDYKKAIELDNMQK